MTSLGRYHPAGDVPGYDLPPGWTPTETALLEAALDRALGAWDGQEVDRVTRYYDPESDYAGNLLTSIPTSADDDIDAADLLAVSMLSIKIAPRAARAVAYEATATRGEVRRALRNGVIPTGLPITSLDTEPNRAGRVLSALQSLYVALRTAHSDNGNAWVFAAKLCARKRPFLAPVRDRVVCELLNGGPLRRPGIGTFETDIQVFAYLMSAPEVIHKLADVRAAIGDRVGPDRLEASDLRLLDVVLWTKGVGHWEDAD